MGIIPRVVEEIFSMVSDRGSDGSTLCSVSVSYLEIYNEHIKDLLLTGDPPAKGYTMQKDEHGNYVVNGLTHVAVRSLRDVAHCLELGSRMRSTAATNMNAHSSRSHAVFTIRLDQEPVDAGFVGASGGDDAVPVGGAASGATAAVGMDTDTPVLLKKTSLFRLVDLAGSERAKKTGAEGDRLKEATNINQSLTTLGNCIMALATKSKHVPYRNSKLTQLLMNSLGGNSATLMVACVSPADTNFEETLQTLRCVSVPRRRCLV
jgi:hypothetical protein